MPCKVVTIVKEYKLLKIVSTGAEASRHPSHWCISWQIPSTENFLNCCWNHCTTAHIKSTVFQALSWEGWTYRNPTFHWPNFCIKKKKKINIRALWFQIKNMRRQSQHCGKQTFTVKSHIYFWSQKKPNVKNVLSSHISWISIE